MSQSNAVSIRRLAVAEIPAASALLGRGMRDNPTHIRAFGSQPARRERALSAMFAPFMRRQAVNGVVLGAFTEDELVGVAGLSLPGRCQPALADKLRALPALFSASGPGGLWRVYRWTRVWAQQDAQMPRHAHLGPMAVAPKRQGQGIGSALFQRLCDELSERQLVGYLETDLTANVRLYQRFGFTTVAEQPVIGVNHWFMQRRFAR
ncbi:GNAT family N-acetyltransferase [Halomonas garicola]|uniref:GNAT family N-acetyltransferase n=1 Tax=Halomonas garicola TaxID=1690008 RepID=UPI002899CDC5|nr:GNAT family N-acetyltransferase [Halomonas garicola]